MVRLTTLTEEQVKTILDDREGEIKQCLSDILDKKIEKMEEARKPSLIRKAYNHIINYFKWVGDEMDRANKIYDEMGIWKEY